MKFSGQNTGVGSLSLLQGLFPTQGSNPGLLLCRRIFYQLSYQGSPSIPDYLFHKEYMSLNQTILILMAIMDILNPRNSLYFSQVTLLPMFYAPEPLRMRPLATIHCCWCFPYVLGIPSPHGWKSLVGYSPQGHKESDTTERLHSLTKQGNIASGPITSWQTEVKYFPGFQNHSKQWLQP